MQFDFRQFLSSYWRTIILIFIPIILLPVALCWKPEKVEIAECAYVVLVMGIYWATEALPLAATALIPLVAFPLCQIQTAKEVADAYVQDISFLFIGGLIVGVAFEEVNLHRRIALNVLLLVGDQPRWLLAGIMVNTAFLSMWISNTATTAMMVPVVLSLASELIRTERSGKSRTISVAVAPEPTAPQSFPLSVKTISQPSVDVEKETMESEKFELRKENLSKKELNLCKAMLLAVCYSASLGGTATLTGTGPNLVLTGLLSNLSNDHPVNFARDHSQPPNLMLKQILKEELSKLGKVSFAEISLIFWFLALLFLWFTRSYLWGELFTLDGKKYVSDGTSAILIALVLFAWPKQAPFFGGLRSSPPLLTWETVEKKLSWGIVFLIGGGFALGGAVKKTGLSELIAQKRCLNPLYLTLPTAEAASFAFMLPVATPPNAIVFASGLMKVTDMIAAGFVMNLFCMCEVMLSIHTWGYAMFNLGLYPDWARPGNSTLCL